MASATIAKLMDSLKFFFRADIVLDSGLHVGAGNFDDARGLATCRRDAQGHLIIPGQSLAGVFVDTLLRSNFDPKRKFLPKITGKAQALADVVASRLIFHHARPLDPETANFACDRRDGVRLNRATRTAQHGAKFAREVVEPGIRFRLYLECDFDPSDSLETRKNLISIILALLEQRWMNPQAPNFLGAVSARGSGWFHLENLHIAVVASIDDLESFLLPGEVKSWVDQHLDNISLSDLQQWSGLMPIDWPDCQSWDVKVTVIQDHQGYGAWPLLVRSAPSKGLISEEDITFVRTRRWLEPDDQGRQSPQETLFIPGSSLRGAARSHVERLVAGGLWLVNISPDDIEKLFGDEGCETGSRLFVRDAYLSESGGREQLVHHVALDEFTRGAMEGAKFDAKPLFDGQFCGRLILEKTPQDNADSFAKKVGLINKLLAWGQAGWIPLGAHQTPVQWTGQQEECRNV